MTGLDMWVFLNDRFVPESEAMVSVFDHGFLYGDGLFETLRAYSGRIFALQQHLERLSVSATQLELSIPDRELLKKRLFETLERNQLGDALIRLTVTRGSGREGLRPGLCTKGTFVISARPLKFKPEQKGVDAVIVSNHRTSATGEKSCPKSLSFLNNIVARLEADREGVFEGIFLNKDGFLAEGTISNLFWIKNGTLFTPSSNAPILKGITRDMVIDLAKKNGVVVKEGLFPSLELMEADEAFLSNSAIELLPLTAVNGKTIGAGLTGPITQKLHQLFQKSREAHLSP